MEVPVGDAMIGRVVNPLGQPIDGLGEIVTDKTRPVEAMAPGVMQRKSVNEPMQTGLKAIDALVPIGRGQRELVIGDRKTGKHRLQSIQSSTKRSRYDLYLCSHWTKRFNGTYTSRNIEKIWRNGLYDRSQCGRFSTCTIAITSHLMLEQLWVKEFMYNGKHVLIIFDDLSKQAVAYRELSLLLRRPPGREAYPGMFSTCTHVC